MNVEWWPRAIPITVRVRVCVRIFYAGLAFNKKLTEVKCHNGWLLIFFYHLKAIGASFNGFIDNFLSVLAAVSIVAQPM